MPEAVTLRRVVTLTDRDDRAVKGFHEIETGAEDLVMTQVFDHTGLIITLPGAGRAWKQEPGKVYIPQLGSPRYPIKVVII